MMLFQMRLITQDPLRAADTFSESDVTRHSFSVNMAHFPSKCHTDSLSLFGCFGQSGWCCFLFSPFCGLLSPPSSCCSLLQRWMSTGFLFSDVFCNSSLCSICLSDRSRLKSSSYILSWWEKTHEIPVTNTSLRHSGRSWKGFNPYIFLFGAAVD